MFPNFSSLRRERDGHNIPPLRGSQTDTICRSYKHSAPPEQRSKEQSVKRILRLKYLPPFDLVDVPEALFEFGVSCDVLVEIPP
jgi:hypothetical protein